MGVAIGLTSRFTEQETEMTRIETSTYAGLYSTSAMMKCQTLTDLVGANIRPDFLADALSDGCGGCEQLRHGNTLVSVLTDIAFDITLYVKVVFDDYDTTVVGVEFLQCRDDVRIPNDSLKAYMGILNQGEWHTPEEFGYFPTNTEEDES